VDLQEKHRLDLASQVAKVKERARRARPWRSIFALVIAIAAIIVVKWLGVPIHAGREFCYPDQTVRDPSCLHGFHPGKLITLVGTTVFFLCGVVAVLGLSGKARSVLQSAIGSAHAAVVRYALVLVGAIAIILITLNLVDVSVGQLIVGGALTGVLIGIAAQQALGNVFAGLVLMFARPFVVGDRIWVRSGALSGTLEGTVVEISITYVRLDTSDGLLSLPNSQVLAAVIGPARPPPPQPASMAAWQPGNPLAGQLIRAADGRPASPAAWRASAAGQEGPAAGQQGGTAAGQQGDAAAAAEPAATSVTGQPGSPEAGQPGDGGPASL
jgi:hypothetical protein